MHLSSLVLSTLTGKESSVWVFPLGRVHPLQVPQAMPITNPALHNYNNDCSGIHNSLTSLHARFQNIKFNVTFYCKSEKKQLNARMFNFKNKNNSDCPWVSGAKDGKEEMMSACIHNCCFAFPNASEPKQTFLSLPLSCKSLCQSNPIDNIIPE